ncbi:MAG: hypothetical protein K0S23_1634 [Fluviicola sp.]|jgi:GDP/UDP-N,N'-diacetylbacillosamine 2-epimerase (hydrolysing)|uniref:UDP-N-acetylglucosamine 2-epimerase n=1 Tax=Fluviicola sp. TaxID=1917219 RepID=UPI002612C5F1|nr:UDP-N-acetylglucosamine 2-epimerase [Fluviicola sp.]MDF3027327.1 hypothetical protein [Fluviicola sp.]
MNIAVLTSSRADYGIYLPLLRKLQEDPEIRLSIIAFGTHTSSFHGHTIDVIRKDGFQVSHELNTLVNDDSPSGIAMSYAKTAESFASFWAKNTAYDWIICLGDRFEMSAAVQASIPFQYKIAHLYAGDTTLGAIDNIYRHQLTLASKLHFVSIPEYQLRVTELIGKSGTSSVIGSLSLLNLKELDPESPEEFFSKWGISLHRKFILVTVHPETVNFQLNEVYAGITESALRQCLSGFDLVITMPNADTNGEIYRTCFQRLKKEAPEKVHLIENFGTKSYFTAMKHAALLVGNSSSGIYEAASFGKMVLNIGDRQKGRIAPQNVKHVRFNEQEIVDAVLQNENLTFDGDNPFSVENGVELIIERLKNYQ